MRFRRIHAENDKMSRGPCSFRQRDISAAVRALRKAGVDVARVIIDRDGKIVIETKSDDESAVANPNPWDDVK